MKAVKIHHPLADIQIKPLTVHHVSALKAFIQNALDDYIDEDIITLSDVRNRMQKRHGETYKTPGYHLKIYRTRADYTQVALAKKLGVKQHHISEMERNKRNIGKTLAKKLASVLKCDYRKFL